MQTYEILVIGAGPAGMSAALSAARCGARVTMLDAYSYPGGQYFHQPPERFWGRMTPRQREGRQLWEQVRQAGVDIFSETTALNLTAGKEVLFYRNGHTEMAQAERVIIAAGAYERTAAFPGWTLPGVITAGAAQMMLYQGVRPGASVLCAGTGPLQLVTAGHLLEAGVRVVMVLEGARFTPSFDGALAMAHQRGRILEGVHSMSELLRHGVQYRVGWGIVAARGTVEVEGAAIARLDRLWRPIPGTEQEVACDTICTGYGFAPFNALAKLAGAEHTWRYDLGGEVPVRDENFETTVPGIFAAGDGAGIGGYRMAMLEGVICGAAAAAQLSRETGRDAVEKIIREARLNLKREQRFQRYYASLFTPGPGVFTLAKDETTVCRCEGVTMRQLEGAIRGGARSLREVKTLTRCGMGECQGRVCGQQVSQTVARLTGASAAEVGLFSPRPPVFPVPVGAMMDGEESEPMNL